MKFPRATRQLILPLDVKLGRSSASTDWPIVRPENDSFLPRERSRHLFKVRIILTLDA